MRRGCKASRSGGVVVVVVVAGMEGGMWWWEKQRCLCWWARDCGEARAVHCCAVLSLCYARLGWAGHGGGGSLLCGELQMCKCVLGAH